ncbi:MAG: YajQ family cyclic di-GMP-binding protein [Gallionellales bacterium CG_4_10_14_3_um_filter_54_96]|nr:MAG: YajQ family cyclic di-GMP-binding protein [Gallionellaceae bacterium CG1_02_56_997]PIV15849.1 MAG: YajQ family cyclic di-GMP-binding protein [Gallionellales bacterium CG03_land_8_20_14_0_80_55_15]PIX05126.1 MAG: YajQ family cyclic di-GMP-binding protein [Gallionellales bacterium CG_4_8_14_3_um_filter_54_18]PIY04205.1 MAG: YajQ family cyclic di-GMP-binding protein [Gallionellales bacterium CG_4_10_14_3_um_filter_54_96]PJC05915.1 MAG: YajQ family cyclic di-GMP-binding protein [Gallionella
MPSFDIVSEVNKEEVKNAVEQANKEIGNRFDFKGSDAHVEQAELKLTVWADNEFQLGQAQDILNNRLIKRGVDIKCLEISDKVEKVSGNKVKRSCDVKVGVETELAKKIVKHIKDSKMKVQASIQGDTVRITGKNRDDLQDAIAFVKKTITDFPLQYQNFRD